MALETKPQKLYRSRDDNYIAGVAGGLGNYFSVDPVIFRVLFTVLAFVNAVGVLVYILLWLILEKKPQLGHISKEHIHNTERGSTSRAYTESYDTKTFSDGFSSIRRNGIAIILIVVGILALFSRVFAEQWLRFDVLWPASLILIGVYLMFGKNDN